MHPLPAIQGVSSVINLLGSNKGKNMKQQRQTNAAHDYIEGKEKEKKKLRAVTFHEPPLLVSYQFSPNFEVINNALHMKMVTNAYGKCHTS